MDRDLRRVTPHVARRQAIRRRTRLCHSRFYARCAHWSFHAEVPAAVFRWSRERWVLGAGACLLALLTLLGIPAWASLTPRATPPPPVSETLSLKLPPAPREPAVAPPRSWKTVDVQPGQTLSQIFQAQGFSGADLASVMEADQDAAALKVLHPGDELGFLTTADGSLEGFRYHPDPGSLVTLSATDHGMQSRMTTLPIERRLHFAHGEVRGSLFAAGEQAGLSEVMVLKLADVFKYDIDFIKDLQRGDQFTIIYDDVYRNGKYAHAGDVIAAEFVNKGYRYTAYRFQEPDGKVAYFSEDGRPLRKALLRTPVSFTRISSKFGMRDHPILGYTRMHKGVDYAAPKGTPIHAAGDGVITFRGRAHGYGNFITIRDSPKYTTAYGHMSRFAPGLHVGSHVTQGEVIGYVGMTGLATGPHLHYEVRVNGKPRNPLTVTMPKPKPLDSRLLAEFKLQTAPLVARIHLIDNATQRLARVDNASHAAAATN